MENRAGKSDILLLIVDDETVVMRWAFYEPEVQARLPVHCPAEFQDGMRRLDD